MPPEPRALLFMSGDDDELARNHIQVARRWVAVAGRDFQSAHACLNAGIPETAAYRCQQAVEKSMKGLPVLSRVPFRRMHDLEALRDLVLPGFSEFSVFVERLVPLTDWGHVFRYPDVGDEAVPSTEELLAALYEIDGFSARVAAAIDRAATGG